jgi:hypothetical protein
LLNLNGTGGREKRQAKEKRQSSRLNRFSIEEDDEEGTTMRSYAGQEVIESYLNMNKTN